jgi:hypothetical protein
VGFSTSQTPVRCQNTLLLILRCAIVSPFFSVDRSANRTCLDLLQPESLAKRSATQRQHKQAIQNWKPSDLPGWLTRDVYMKQVQPALATVTKSRIRSVLGVSEPYASDIRAGKRIPHVRHWRALTQLVGIRPDV